MNVNVSFLYSNIRTAAGRKGRRREKKKTVQTCVDWYQMKRSEKVSKSGLSDLWWMNVTSEFAKRDDDGEGRKYYSEWMKRVSLKMIFSWIFMPFHLFPDHFDSCCDVLTTPLVFLLIFAAFTICIISIILIILLMIAVLVPAVDSHKSLSWGWSDSQTASVATTCRLEVFGQ